MTRHSASRYTHLAFAGLVFTLLMAACGGDGEGGPAHQDSRGTPTTVGAPSTVVPTATSASTEEPAVNIGVKQWSVTVDVPSVPKGETVYRATNSGTIPHEVVFLRTDLLVDELPVGPDSKVNRLAEGIEDLGVIRTDALVPGATVRESFDLPAGNYALICNIPGHYQAGMFVAFSIE